MLEMKMILEGINRFIPRKPDQKSQVLTSSDEYLLKKGLESLYQYLKEREDRQLPQAYFFPETAGRLLIYAIRPVLERVYIDRNLDLPPIITINTPKQGEVNSSEQEEALQQNLIANLRKIKLINNLDGISRVMVIDDEVYHGRTLDSLQKAFDDLYAEIEVEGFVFLAGYGGMPKNTTVGNPGIPSPEAAQLFAQINASVTGVQKDKKAAEFGVQKSDSRDPEKMKAIRHELEKIGQSVAEEV